MSEYIHGADVRVEISVDADVERAFAVFTEQGHTWWPAPYKLGQGGARTGLVIEPKAGGRWYETTDDGAECAWGTVLAFDAPNHLALSWAITPTFAPEPDENKASRVDVTFAADGAGKTTVVLVHSQLERHGDGWEQARDGLADQGAWPGVLAAYAALASST
ncbi:SRPBCC family protein [Streptodolium elevatio]|uniref:SRPBCC family protein n=1 Tax=Streptodolium elevatio TaxID=3157996 RepID=A0ABV3DI53_9ACTN